MTARPGDFTTFSSYLRPDVHITTPRPEIPPSEIFLADDDYRSKYLGKPVAHFYHQLNTIQDINGVYEKGMKSTDDLVRSAVLGIKVITDPKFVEKHLKDIAPDPVSALGAIGSYNGSAMYNTTTATNSDLGVISGSTTASIDAGSLIASRNRR